METKEARLVRRNQDLEEEVRRLEERLADAKDAVVAPEQLARVEELVAEVKRLEERVESLEEDLETAERDKEGLGEALEAAEQKAEGVEFFGLVLPSAEGFSLFEKDAIRDALVEALRLLGRRREALDLEAAK